MKSNQSLQDTIIRRAITEFLNNSECQLANTPDVFIAIYKATNGQPCADCALKPCNLLSIFKNQDKQSSCDSYISRLTGIDRRDITAFTIQAGCRLAKETLFEAIYNDTNGYPCNDCGLKPCFLYDAFKDQDKRGVSNKPTIHSCDLKTNSELAAKWGISKRQVAKRRISGTNDLRSE